MNRSQLAKYHITLKQWASVRTARGVPAGEDAIAKLKQRPIGRVCSSKDFSQLDLDRMLGAFLAETEPGNLNAQLDQQDQELRRISGVVARCFHAGRYFIHGNDDTHQHALTENYLEGICRRLNYDQGWHQVTLQQAGVVMGIMERRARKEAQKTGKLFVQWTPESKPQNEEPF